MTRFFITTLLAFLSAGSMTLAAQERLTGLASHYSNSLHGRKMSNGQPYDLTRMTCAHKTLPFGTMLRVVCPNTGREVVVEVTDRGPYIPGRIIDLSYAAAFELGIIGRGVDYVTAEILSEGYTPLPHYDDIPSDLPEIDYSMVGSCYEFLPKWKHVPTEEDGINLQRDMAWKILRDDRKTQSTPSLPGGNTEDTLTDSKQKIEGDSRKWTDFFENLKDKETTPLSQ